MKHSAIILSLAAIFLASCGKKSSTDIEPSPPVSPTASTSAGTIVNPNTTPVPPQPQQNLAVFDVKKLATMTRPSVALVTVYDKSGKVIKLGSGFFVSPDGKFVTNSHVIEGAANATAKLENGAT